MENNSSENWIGNFIVYGDGTVTDTRTGLMWMRCALGQTWDGKSCVGEAKGFTWDEAMALRHIFSDYEDWQLPDINELKSIVDRTQLVPTINRQVFPKAPSAFFWSRSTDLPLALGTYFNNGTSGPRGKHSSRYVRLLRGGLPITLSESGEIKQGLSLSFSNSENGETENQAATLNPAINDSISSDLDPKSKITIRNDVAVNKENSPNRIGDFIDHGDGTVTDTRTGLMWMRCALGQTWDGATCVGKPQGFTWDEAMALCHIFADYEDWRLPGLDELESIVDVARCVPAGNPAHWSGIREVNVFSGSPSIDTNVFLNAPSSHFWSSTRLRGTSPWGVGFHDGRAASGSTGFNNHVRLVRNGQQKLESDPSDFETLDFESHPLHASNGHGILGKTWDEAMSQSCNSSEPIKWAAIARQELPNWPSRKAFFAAIKAQYGLFATADSERARRAFNAIRKAVYRESEIVKMQAHGEDESVNEMICASLVQFAAEIDIQVDVLLEHLHAAGIDKSHATENLTEQDKTRFLDYLRNTYGIQAPTGKVTLNRRQRSMLLGAVIENDVIPSEHEAMREITTVIERSQLLEEKLSGSLATVEYMGDAHLSSKSIVRAAINYIRQQPELFAAEITELRGFLGEAGATHVSMPVATNPSVLAEPETLEQVVAWLATQETIALSELRSRLLPLDLLPAAVIDDLNERALDLTGDLALEEDGEKLIIVREVLAQLAPVW